MQLLTDVQTVIKSAALISAVGAIGIRHAWPKRWRMRRPEDEEKMLGWNVAREKRDGDGYRGIRAE